MTAVIETRDLTKVYKDFWGRPRHKGLDGLSISIEAGEVFGLFGPNGSGKTTTFKLLLGLIFPRLRPRSRRQSRGFRGL